MTFTISKSKLAIAIVAVALAIPSGAMAFHVFDDVPDDKFYADPVEWAFDNGITTGRSPTSFAPDDSVTRGESVTFLKRYNDNIVEVADAALQEDIDTNTGAIDALMTPIAVGHVSHNGGTPVVSGAPEMTATYDGGSGTYTVSIAGETLTQTTHLVQITPIRVNTNDATADRTAQTYYGSGSVRVSIWDQDAAESVATNFHITVYAIS